MPSFAATLVTTLALLPTVLAADEVLVEYKFGTSSVCDDRVDQTYLYAYESGSDCSASAVACAQTSSTNGEYQIKSCEGDLASLTDGKIGAAFYSNSDCTEMTSVYAAYQENHCFPTSSATWSYVVKAGSDIKMYDCTTNKCDVANSAECTLASTYSALYSSCTYSSAMNAYARGFYKISYTSTECFSGGDTVTLESGEAKRLSEVALGDKVQTADASGILSFSEIVALPHAANNKLASFVNVATASGKSIKATKMHLLQQCDGSLAYAGSLAVGDCLRTVDGGEAVAAVSMTTAEGTYTAVTNNEFLVVNGIVASPFAVTHGLTNAYYNVHRFVAKVYPSALKSPLVLAANAFLGSAFVAAGGSNSK